MLTIKETYKELMSNAKNLTSKEFRTYRNAVIYYCWKSCPLATYQGIADVVGIDISHVWRIINDINEDIDNCIENEIFNIYKSIKEGPKTDC